MNFYRIFERTTVDVTECGFKKCTLISKGFTERIPEEATEDTTVKFSKLLSKEFQMKLRKCSAGIAVGILKEISGWI